MLLGNNSRVYGAGPLRFLGSHNNVIIHHTNHITVGGQFGFDAGEATGGQSQRSGLPQAYRHPYTWRMPQKAGSIGTFGEIAGSGSLTANLAGGLNAESD